VHNTILRALFLVACLVGASWRLYDAFGVHGTLHLDGNPLSTQEERSAKREVTDMLSHLDPGNPSAPLNAKPNTQFGMRFKEHINDIARVQRKFQADTADIDFVPILSGETFANAEKRSDARKQIRKLRIAQTNYDKELGDALDRFLHFMLDASGGKVPPNYTWLRQSNAELGNLSFKAAETIDAYLNYKRDTHVSYDPKLKAVIWPDQESVDGWQQARNKAIEALQRYVKKAEDMETERQKIFKNGMTELQRATP